MGVLGSGEGEAGLLNLRCCSPLQQKREIQCAVELLLKLGELVAKIYGFFATNQALKRTRRWAA